MYENRFLENIKKLYKSSGKCDYQHQYKYIIEASMVYKPEGLIDNIPMAVSTLVIMKNPTARN